MPIALGPLVIAVIGLITFLLGRNNADIREIGRCLMWCGTLAVLLLSGHSTLALGPLITAVVGLIIFLIAGPSGEPRNSEAREIGKCLMWCGTLATLLLSGHSSIKV